MKRTVLAALCVAAAYAAPMAAADPLTYDGLKTMLTGMGYTPKDIVKTSPKIEILVVTDAFNVPIGLEITPSGRFIWATANLGESKIDGDRALQLLKRAPDWQPTQFWLTSSNTLTIGLAINNTDIKPDLMKFALEKIAGDVSKSSDVWQVSN